MRQDIKLVMCSTEINKDGYIAKGMEVNFTLPASLSSQTYNMTEMEAKKGQGETREGRSERGKERGERIEERKEVMSMTLLRTGRWTITNVAISNWLDWLAIETPSILLSPLQSAGIIAMYHMPGFLNLILLMHAIWCPSDPRSFQGGCWKHQPPSSLWSVPIAPPSTSLPQQIQLTNSVLQLQKDRQL